MVFPQFKNKHKGEALFHPEDYVRYWKYPENLPKKYVIVYSPGVLNYFKKKYHPRKIRIDSHTDVYVHKGIGVLRMKGVGSPHSGMILEELIGRGGKEFLNVGLAGGLQKEGVFLCTKALRDEGTSHHYLPHGRFAYPDNGLTKKLGNALKGVGLKYSDGITWTIDAPYRETKKEIKHYHREGISTVEMETSALFAIAKYRKVKIAAAFIVSDVLGNKWEPNFHKLDVKRGLRLMVDASIDCLRN